MSRITSGIPAGAIARTMVYPTISALAADPLYSHLIDIANELSKSKEIAINYGTTFPGPPSATEPPRAPGDLFYVNAPSDAEGLYVYTGTSWIQAQPFYVVPRGTAVPGPMAFPQKTISGFDAYSSPDMLSPFFVGLTISGISSRRAQIAVNWNYEENSPADGLRYRVNDDTADINSWGPWTTVLDTNSAKLKDYIVRTGDTMTGDLNFPITANAKSPGVTWTGITDSHKIYVQETTNSESTQLVIENGDNVQDRTVFRHSATGDSQSVKDTLVVDRTYITSYNAVNMTGNKIVNVPAPTAPLDAVNKTYTDASDYLNNYPKAGFSKYDNEVPVYADFKFSLGQWGTPSFTVIDKDSQTVVYYIATTATGFSRPFRARRYSNADSFIFDNDPISVTFLKSATEYVVSILNVGTNFIALGLYDPANNSSRRVMCLTGGSSRWQDWTYLIDFTTLHGGACNVSLVDFGGSYRILSVVYDGAKTILTTNIVEGEQNSGDGGLIPISPSNPATGITPLASITIFDDAIDVAYNDVSGQVKNLTSAQFGFGYNAYGLPSGFTWNPISKTFYQKTGGYYVAEYYNGRREGRGFALDICWNIPDAWIAYGVGTPSNLVPTKTGSARYYAIQNSTWNTPDGGMNSDFGANGVSYSMTTDEYTGDMFLTSKPTFDTRYCANYYTFPIGQTYQSIVASNMGYSYGFLIPDGSAWSKAVDSSFTTIVGDNIVFTGASSNRGYQTISAQFSTSSFNSSSTGVGNILKLDNANAVVGGWAFPPGVGGGNNGSYGTTVANNTSTVYWCFPGQPVLLASAAGSIRSYSPSGISVPGIPTTISQISGLDFANSIVWNASTTNPIFYALVRNSNSVYLAKCAAGTWTIPSPGTTLFTEQIAYGAANRGDGQNILYTGYSSSLLTENGRFLFGVGIPNTGDTATFIGTYNINTNAFAVTVPTQYEAQPNSFGGLAHANDGGGRGFGFGWSGNFGYFVALGSNSSNNIQISSSRNMGGTGQALSEDAFFTPSDSATGGRYGKFITVENVTGLVAYVIEYPIFIGGYLTKVPNTTVALAPYSINYIYASKTQGDRAGVVVTASTKLQPSSFSKLLLAKITTDADNITDSYVYAHDGMGLADQTSRSGQALKTDGKRTYWGPVIDKDYADANYAPKTGGLDADLIGVPPGTISYHASPNPPAGWLIANGLLVSTTTYADLFSVIGYTHGGGGSVFALPDLRGEFIRGFDGGRGVDLSRIFGSMQADELRSHTHLIQARANGSGTGSSGPFVEGPYNRETSATGGVETRPRNVALLPIIKYSAVTGKTLSLNVNTVQLPAQAGNASKALKTNGTSVYWDALPDLSSVVLKTGSAMSGYLDIPSPVSPSNAANKQYVDAAVAQAGFTQSFAYSGYTRMPNGLIIQWGSIASGYSQFNFPITFPNSCFSIAGQSIAQVVVISNSSFTAASDAIFDDNGSFLGWFTGYYIAIGY